jgi:hypothetical protein
VVTHYEFCLLKARGIDGLTSEFGQGEKGTHLGGVLICCVGIWINWFRL